MTLAVVASALLLIGLAVYFIEPGLYALALSVFAPLFVRNPPFVDMDVLFPEHRRIQEAFADIRAEAVAMLRESERIPRFHEVDPLQTSISGRDDVAWRTFFLKGYGIWHERNVRLLPKTVAVLERIPAVDTAMLSIMDGGKHVPPHHGFFKGVYRYHLGLIVPTDAPVFIVCGGQEYHWAEGEGVMFDDTYRHEVWNKSSKPRVVLFCSVRRHDDLPRWIRPLTRLVHSMIRRSPKLKRAAKKAEVTVDR